MNPMSSIFLTTSILKYNNPLSLLHTNFLFFKNMLEIVEVVLNEDGIYPTLML